MSDFAQICGRDARFPDFYALRLDFAASPFSVISQFCKRRICRFAKILALFYWWT